MVEFWNKLPKNKEVLYVLVCLKVFKYPGPAEVYPRLLYGARQENAEALMVTFRFSLVMEEVI